MSCTGPSAGTRRATPPKWRRLPTNARRLVEAVSRYVAHRGFAPAAVTAVAATVLWLIDKIGQEAFCRFYTPLFAAAGRDGAGT
ncbi:MAG: hypothetical protein KatS3mg131_0204 [Candidatus Tectimicrobiota bacterium]|nr:MAG: hypothetical protein KatS3mg131_0204 [Candidatus Tectomicrobia bacterium]